MTVIKITGTWNHMDADLTMTNKAIFNGGFVDTLSRVTLHLKKFEARIKHLFQCIVPSIVVS